MRILYAYLSIFVVFFTLISGVYALEYSGRLRVTEVEDHSISLSWEEQEGAASYIVYYDYTDTLDPADPQYFEQSDPVTTTSTIVANLEADAYFSFVVVALDDAGNESENTSNQVTVKTFQERPAFALDQNDVFVEDSKKIIVGFTRVLDLEAPQEVRVFDLDSG